VAFFETEPVEKNVVFTPANRSAGLTLGGAQMQNLAQDLAGKVIQPFVVDLKTESGSGDRLIVHTGYEFVYCLSGKVQYRVDAMDYLLEPGDSLTFAAHLPHVWKNAGTDAAQIILVLVPVDEREEPIQRHIALFSIKQELTMKIAVITDDGKTISQHFGRAHFYQVFTLEEGKIINREMREKMGHDHFHQEEPREHVSLQPHGQDAASHDRHTNMAAAIADCKALICGGMGMGAYNSMIRLDIQPVVTELHDIEEAVKAFIDGKLVDHTELLH